MEIIFSMRMMNGVIKNCFQDCVKDFKTDQLQPQEKLCLNNCSSRSVNLVKMSLEDIVNWIGDVTRRRIDNIDDPTMLYKLKDYKDSNPDELLLLQNLGNQNSYNVGSFSCRVPNTALVFIIKLIYILFWTWVLNLICKDGHTTISWLLVLLPWIMLFVMMGILMINM